MKKQNWDYSHHARLEKLAWIMSRLPIAMMRHPWTLSPTLNSCLRPRVSENKPKRTWRNELQLSSLIIHVTVFVELLVEWAKHYLESKHTYAYRTRGQAQTIKAIDYLSVGSRLQSQVKWFWGDSVGGKGDIGWVATSPLQSSATPWAHAKRRRTGLSGKCQTETGENSQRPFDSWWFTTTWWSTPAP